MAVENHIYIVQNKMLKPYFTSTSSSVRYHNEIKCLFITILGHPIVFGNSKLLRWYFIESAPRGLKLITRYRSTNKFF